ncbi:MAG: nuclear transport factor 2 family protein [Candidatus Zixiibacteriota bacterium]|nr:MAG: nuclear transport factor 2 family protein [candidate division Zixibacteria bacterium]
MTNSTNLPNRIGRGITLAALAAVLVLVTGPGCVTTNMAVDVEAEREAVTQLIHASIGWAIPEKDRDLCLAVNAHDSSFFIFHPDSASTIVGFDAFESMVDNVFMNPAFRSVSYEIRDLRVNIARSGSVAWYSCILDDRGEWNGQPVGWSNTRWTGVLEKREAGWLIVQMHFSFASDAESDEAEDEGN